MNAIHFKTLFLISMSAVVSIPAIAAPASAAKKAPPEPKELKLAQAKKCLTCHTVDKKLVGPAWKDVAVKYRGQKGAEAKLIQKVAKGGSGVWGPTPMPPNAPQVSQSDIKTLVRFILRLK